MSEQSNLQVIQNLYAAFSRGDMEAVLDAIDPEANFQFEGSSAIPWSGNRDGKDGWSKFFQAVGENLEDVRLQMEPFAVQGDRVVMAGRYQARVRQTGKPVDSPLVHLWTLRNGRIVNCLELANTAAEAIACTHSAAA